MNNPRQDVIKRVAARLLRANEAKVIDLGPKVRPDCVSALTRDFVTPGVRKNIVAAWRKHVHTITSAGWVDPRPKPKLDAAVADLT